MDRAMFTEADINKATDLLVSLHDFIDSLKPTSFEHRPTIDDISNKLDLIGWKLADMRHSV